MTTAVQTLKKMVLSIVQSKNGEPLKPSQIAALIEQQYPDYCDQKTQNTSQAEFNLLKQIAAEISANSKKWMVQQPALKSSEETPRTYWWEGEAVAIQQHQAVSTSQPEIAESLKEEKLYPLLAIYLNAMRPRNVYPKRIDEKTSSNTHGKNGNKWLHPDMVALEDVMTGWSNDTKGWATKAGARQAKLWSFEVKVEINTVPEAREAYFQAVANSKWANFGFLVATKFSDKATRELKILNELHGIGVIQLNVQNPADETIVKFHSHEREHVDWNTCNRIAEQNSNFKKFIEQVADFHLTRKTSPSDWDIPDALNPDQ